MRHFEGTARAKDVLDFGCGDGALCYVLLDDGAKSAHGIDLDEKGLQRFAERLKIRQGPTYGHATNPRKIELPDSSFDAIYCMDVMEHVMDYGPIIGEWHRVLRPGGSVYIWWQQHWHPYGHHAMDWIPIPWAHIFLNDKEINEVCARIVDWDGFDTPVWDRNPDGSRRNRFRDAGAGSGFLNKLTTWQFERCAQDAGFTFARRHFQSFGGWARLPSRVLSRIPRVRDYFMACAVYELRR
jgi:SAM-dependent methyltransferase